MKNPVLVALGFLLSLFFKFLGKIYKLIEKEGLFFFLALVFTLFTALAIIGVGSMFINILYSIVEEGI